MAKLSPVMQDALEHAISYGRLVRWRGGFWTYPGCAVKHVEPHGNVEVPTWHVGIGTISALVKRDKLRVDKTNPRGHETEVVPCADPT